MAARPAAVAGAKMVSVVTAAVVSALDLVLWRQLVRLQHQPLDPATVLQVSLEDLVDVGV